MQQSYVTQHLHLKRNCTSNTRRQFTFNLRALDSGDCSEVAFVDWWDNFLAPAVLPTTRSFSCWPLGLQSSRIKFLMRAPSVRKHVNCTLYKLLRCQSSLREAKLASKSAINGTKSTARGVIDFLAPLKASSSDGLLCLTPLLPQRLAFIATVWTQWQAPLPQP